MSPTRSPNIGRREVYARGKVLGRVEGDQRHDLPARRPDGLPALGGGHPGIEPGTTRAACRTSSAWRTRCTRRPKPVPRPRRAVEDGSGPAVNPLFKAFFAAVQEAGYPLTDDVNGYKQEGFAAFDRNIYRGHRLSAARAYLHPVEDRPNLEVRTRAFVSKINFQGKRAVGCDVVHNRRTETIEAGEVLLCGGAINSPQLLQLSGVGRGSELRSLGVDVVQDVPAVGENLQDHLEVYIQYQSKLPVSVAPALKMRNRPWVGAAWLLARRGAGATNHFEGGGFIRSNEDVAYPNLMYHFLPVAIRYDGTAPQGHGYQVHVGPMYSDARGTIKIKSTDPREHPAIQFNYLSTKTDRREWIEAVRISRNILNQPAFDAYNGGELSPGPSVETDQEILDWVAKDSETALHPSCTCRLGAGEDSVIDPLSMKVHGLEGLRVVDASSMRYVTNGNIYAPTMMLAEKSADMILGNTPLAPIKEPFYVHQKKDGSAVTDGRAAGGGSRPDGAAGSGAAEAAPADSPTADV